MAKKTPNEIYEELFREYNQLWKVAAAKIGVNESERTNEAVIHEFIRQLESYLHKEDYSLGDEILQEMLMNIGGRLAVATLVYDELINDIKNKCVVLWSDAERVSPAGLGRTEAVLAHFTERLERYLQTKGYSLEDEALQTAIIKLDPKLKSAVDSYNYANPDLQEFKGLIAAASQGRDLFREAKIEDPYDIDLKKRLRKITSETHPDKNPSYGSDPNVRKQYDSAVILLKLIVNNYIDKYRTALVNVGLLRPAVPTPAVSAQTSQQPSKAPSENQGDICKYMKIKMLLDKKLDELLPPLSNLNALSEIESFNISFAIKLSKCKNFEELKNVRVNLHPTSACKPIAEAINRAANLQELDISLRSLFSGESQTEDYKMKR